MKRIALIPVILSCLHAETVRIDAGSATDEKFLGGQVATFTTLPAGVDPNMRYGTSFSYLVPALAKWPYMITFGFCEPSYKKVGERVFSVRVGNQVVVEKLDLVAEGAILNCLTRSVLALASDEAIRIKFDTDRLGRNAVVSYIELTPLFQPTASIPGAVETAARAVIEVRCIRCHDYPENNEPGVRIGINVLGDVGNLNMRTKESMLRGGNRGPALVPGDPMGSRLYQNITRYRYASGSSVQKDPYNESNQTLIYEWRAGHPRPPQTASMRQVGPADADDSVAMPPDAQLDEAEIGAIREWILAGAPWTLPAQVGAQWRSFEDWRAAHHPVATPWTLP